jgi:hypothetical protein
MRQPVRDHSLLQGVRLTSNNVCVVVSLAKASSLPSVETSIPLRVCRTTKDVMSRQRDSLIVCVFSCLWHPAWNASADFSDLSEEAVLQSDGVSWH